MKTKYIFPGVLLVALAGVAFSVFLFSSNFDTYCEFKIVDSVSKSWVWDAEVSLAGKVMRIFYQSDEGSKTFRFTHIKPGNYEMTIKAPDYVEKTIPVKIKAGRNEIEPQIELTGYRIPGIAEIFVYKDRDAENLYLNPRPLDKEGKGIGMHPCIDMWFGLRISVQLRNGVYVTEPMETGSQRGEELFSGKLGWVWESYPDDFYRYKITLQRSNVKKHNAPYNVYDYIIILPDPRKIAISEIDARMSKAMETGDYSSLKKLLEGFGDKITYFITNDWNQPAL